MSNFSLSACLPRCQPGCGARVRVIVFSKDRAFQLGQYLRTLLAKSRGATLDVHVLFHVNDKTGTRDFEESYARVQDAFPTVSFERETDFAKQLKELVAGADSHVLFGVDDALFCGDLPLGDAVAALQARPSLLCVHLRLSPGLNFCHTADVIQRLPRLRTLGGELAWFAGGDGSHDWDYPFDLCGTVYSKPVVERILREIEAAEGVDGLSHPNKLEASGNKAIARLRAFKELDQQTHRACLQRRAMVVVTINRVQSIFRNRVFGPAVHSGSQKGQTPQAPQASNDQEWETPQGPPVPQAPKAPQDQDWEVEALDRLLDTGKDLDEDAYLTLSFQYGSVHVGGLHLKCKCKCPGSIVAAPAPADALPLVTVVMPVKDGARFLPAAILSLQRQTLGSNFEVFLNPKP
jgi:hypothetical protein